MNSVERTPLEALQDAAHDFVLRAREAHVNDPENERERLRVAALMYAREFHRTETK